jgi:hypothetical protein
MGMRPSHRLLVGVLALAGLSVGVGGAFVHASATSQAGLGQTNAQAGYLHPSTVFTPPTTPAPNQPPVTCAISNFKCADLAVPVSEQAYGHYVGHDEPSNEFLSSIPGSGNEYRVEMQLPKDPPTEPTQSNGVSWTFMQSIAPWFGMAMCNDDSYPEVHTITSYNSATNPCRPDSDSNIADCADMSGATCTSATGCPPGVTASSACWIGNHVGGAYMEFQFYPPGWAPEYPNETTGGVSCDAKLWCAAMVIWSLGEAGDGTNNNPDCLNNSNGGVEFGNYAYITHSGHSPQAGQPYKNPNAFYPNPSDDLYMNSGDYIVITMHDIPDSSPGPNGSGLEIDVDDLTTGETGSMVASGIGPNNNGFGTEEWDPSPTASCTVIPYNFHPMYSTSGLHTRIPWAAHTYNVAFTDEIGHFDYCSDVTKVNDPTGGCAGNEGPSTDSEAAEPDAGGPGGDDSVCYNGALGQSTTLVPLPGCIGSNLGFDGVSYQPSGATATQNPSTFWPNGDFTTRPTPIRFTSPLTGPNYDQNYSDQAFENDLPALEFITGPAELAITDSSCSIVTGGTAGEAGCTNQPSTDDTMTTDPNTGLPVPSGKSDFGFYPYFSDDTHVPGQCWWMIGQDVALNPTKGNTTEETTDDFDGAVPDSQYGQTGVSSFPYNVPFLQGVAQGEPPVTAPLTEDFHTLNETNTDQFGPYANPNTECAASAITLNTSTPEVPTVPALLLTGGVAAAVLLGGDSVRRRWGQQRAG